MRLRLRYVARLLVAAWIAVVPIVGANAQLATLVADSLSYDGRNKLVAEGNVEVFYKDQRLIADALVYNAETEILQVLGPITLIDADGQVMTATSGELTSDLKEAIIKGARLVIAEQMQVAAVEGHRFEGRYNVLYKSVASSCRVCEHDPTPLWRIRARQVVHDEEERQIHFENAAFEVLGVPVLWTPYMRLPDPTVRRASGLLVPSLSQTSELGLGFRFPYFQTLGDHADITLTPYLSRSTVTLEFRYRQAFRHGKIVVEGAVSRDDLLPEETRAYLFGEGEFNLPRDFKLNLDIQMVSDRAYLETYRYSDADRLLNKAEITRTRRHEYISGSFENLRTLRDSEVPIEETLATNVGRGTFERRFPYLWGGEGRLVFDVLGYERQAEQISPDLAAACVTAMIPASECLARDMFRATAQLGWFRDWTFANGMVGRVEGQVSGDAYVVGQDPAFDERPWRVTPAGAVELRWPLTRETRRGGRDILQPVAQIAWSDSFGDDLPNEDSRLVEFDEGNLLALSRFPGRDVVETGLRGTVGLGWTHFSPTGREYSLAVAKVFRDTDPALFSTASGLDGETSDWLVAGRLEFADRLSLQNRTLFGRALDVAKSETRLTYMGKRLTASSAYVYVIAAPEEGRTQDVSELRLDVGYEFGRHWIGSADTRYDLIEGGPTQAGFGLGYRNECVNIDLSLSRRFTSSTNVTPSTAVGLSVSLNGFGNDGRPYARGCRHVKG